MALSVAPKLAPELHRFEPELPCLYEQIRADELLLTIFYFTVSNDSPREAASMWKRLSVVDRTFYKLMQDYRIYSALIRSKVEIPTRHLLHCIPSDSSEAIIQEAWNVKQQRMICRFWNSKDYTFYTLWFSRLPSEIRSMVTSIDLSASRNQAEKRTFEQLVRIVAQIPLLEKLVLRRCSFVDDSCLEWLSGEATHLKILDLHSCCQITNRGMIALMRHVPHLEELNLTSCKQIGFDGFSAIGLFGSNIRKLHLNDTKLCHYKLQQILPTRGGQLELLDLSQCILLSTDSIRLIVTHCTQLKTLALEACVRINNQSLAAFSEGCPELESLRLSICQSISYHGVRALLASKPSLHNLSLFYCYLTHEECLSLEQEFPLVNIQWRPNVLQSSCSSSSSRGH